MKWYGEAERFLLRFNDASPRPEMRVTSVESAPLIDLPAGGGNKSMNGDATERGAAPRRHSPTDDEENITPADGPRTNREDGPMSQGDTFADIPFADDEDQSAGSLGQEEEEEKEAKENEQQRLVVGEETGEPSCDESRSGTPANGNPDEESTEDLADAENNHDETVPETPQENPQEDTGETENVAEITIEDAEVEDQKDPDQNPDEDEKNEIIEEKRIDEDEIEEERPATEGSSGDESSEPTVCDVFEKKDEFEDEGEIVGSGLSDDEDDTPPPPTILVSPPAPKKGILKKTPSQGGKGRRIVFNEMMTVFSDGCPEMQVPAFRPWDLTYSEMCFMYEPPPEYQDWLPFDPPAEYQDPDGFATLWTRHQMVTSGFCSNGGRADDDDDPSEREMCTDFSEMEDDDGADTTATSESLPIDEVTVDLNDNFDPLTEDPNANVRPVDDDVPTGEEIPEDTAVRNELSEESSDTTETSNDPSENSTEVPFAGFTDESKGLELDLVLTSNAEGDLVRTNSQIRKNIEINALRRSLLRGAEVRRRNAGKRPKSPTVSLTSLEEKLRWLTATDDEEDDTASETITPVNQNESLTIPRPPQQPPAIIPVPEPVNIPNCVPRKPQRWASEVLYPPTTNKPPPPPYCPPGNNKQPLSRPSSFDPNLGRIAWENFIQRDERLLHGSTLSLRNPYSRTAERHPNAASRPDNRGSWTPEGSRVTAFRKSDGRAPTSDELEWFVQQDLERIERIKKRYSLTEENDPTFGFGRRPSVRGIRPRFGSTTEILKQLQSQMQPPSLASPKNVGSHVTWPYPDVTQTRPTVAHCQGHHQHHRSVVVLPQVTEEENAIHHHRSTQCLRFPDPHRTKEMLSPGAAPPPTSKNSLTVVTKDERGTPEGASSSPKVSSDSLYHHHHHHPHTVTSASPPKEAVIYYSMNV